MSNRFNFNISLSVLNHLGRNLYRSLITVIGEAISNSWDADANNVWIQIDRDKGNMAIVDDGIGMTDRDFQNHFLKIGYSKRKDGVFKSPLGRPYIGRKGIGKLALLSCAKRIHIATKTASTEIVGGIIDNSGLDEAIKGDLSSQEYYLEGLDNDYYSILDPLEHGTAILFESLTSGIFNTVDYIRKSIALFFRFSLIDEGFHIFVNDKEVLLDQLSGLSEDTQFLWVINDLVDPVFDNMTNLQEREIIDSCMSIKGYIASVNKPSQLKIRGTNEKVTLDLFVNGRLRDKDILRHIPTTRVVESYIYGQIHFDALDSGNNHDVFTSSREGIISDDPTYKEFLTELSRIFKEIMDQWDQFRRKHCASGDPDNTSITPKARKAQELFNETLRDFGENSALPSKGSLVEEWATSLAEEAQFNIPSYTECFVSENLLRKYIEHSKASLSVEASEEAQRCRKKEQQNKDAANISYDIRQSNKDSMYLDMGYLANFIDKVPSDKPKTAGLSRSAVIYKPIRDAVGHTSLITDTAKSQLTIEYANIKARLSNLLKEMEDKKKDK